jgi:hypothetical protein
MVWQGVCGLYVDVLAKKILPCPDPTKEYFLWIIFRDYLSRNNIFVPFNVILLH